MFLLRWGWDSYRPRFPPEPQNRDRERKKKNITINGTESPRVADPTHEHIHTSVHPSVHPLARPPSCGESFGINARLGTSRHNIEGVRIVSSRRGEEEGNEASAKLLAGIPCLPGRTGSRQGLRVSSDGQDRATSAIGNPILLPSPRRTRGLEETIHPLN